MLQFLRQSNFLTSDRKLKWLMYTVLVGLIPMIVRLIIWAISENRNVEVFHTVDFVVFGLILHTSNINAIEHHNNLNHAWKTVQNGTSSIFILGYGVLFGAYLLGQSNPGTIDSGITKYLAIALSFVSFLLSYSIFNRVSKLHRDE